MANSETHLHESISSFLRSPEDRRIGEELNADEAQASTRSPDAVVGQQLLCKLSLL